MLKGFKRLVEVAFGDSSALGCGEMVGLHDLAALFQQNSLIQQWVDRPAEGWICASKFEGKAITCLKSALEGWGEGRGRQSRGQVLWQWNREQRGLKGHESEGGRGRERLHRKLQRHEGTVRELQGVTGTSWTRNGTGRARLGLMQTGGDLQGQVGTGKDLQKQVWTSRAR